MLAASCASSARCLSLTRAGSTRLFSSGSPWMSSKTTPSPCSRARRPIPSPSSRRLASWRMGWARGSSRSRRPRWSWRRTRATTPTAASTARKSCSTPSSRCGKSWLSLTSRTAPRPTTPATTAVKALGFGQVRVRHHGDVARIEVDGEDIERLVAQREDVAAAVREAGYKFVSVDLEGYATGSLNRAWKPTSPRSS